MTRIANLFLFVRPHLCDARAIRKAVVLLQAHLPWFVPERAGFTDPLSVRKVRTPADFSDLRHLWREGNFAASMPRPRARLSILRGDGANDSHGAVIISVTDAEVTIRSLRQFAIAYATAEDVTYGAIVSSSSQDMDMARRMRLLRPSGRGSLYVSMVPGDMGKGFPGIYSTTILGAAYVNFLGRKEIEASLGEDIVWLGPNSLVFRDVQERQAELLDRVARLSGNRPLEL